MNPIAYHGLVAYSLHKGSVGLYKAAMVCERMAHIAVSDRAIGPIGLAIQGELTNVYASDCWSVVDSQGDRHASRAWVPELRKGKPWNHHDWVTAVRAQNNDWWQEEPPYLEGFMRGHLIRAIWVKSWATRYITTAKALAKVLRVPCIILKDADSRYVDAQYPIDHDPSERWDCLDQ